MVLLILYLIVEKKADCNQFVRSSVELQPVVFFLDLETVNFNDRSDCNQSLSKIVDLQPVVIELQPVVLDLVLVLFIDHGNTSRLDLVLVLFIDHGNTSRLREYVAPGGTIGEERPRHCGPHPPDVSAAA